MSDNWCKTCGDYMMFADTHKCPPSFYVWCEEHHGWNDEEPDKIMAHDHEAAAEKWAESYDSDGEYTIVQGSGVNVIVRGVLDDELDFKFLYIEGETVPQYHAGEPHQRFCDHSFRLEDYCFLCGFHSEGAGSYRCPREKEGKVCGAPLKVHYRKQYIDRKPTEFAHKYMRYNCPVQGCYTHGEVKDLMDASDQQETSEDVSSAEV